MREDRRVIVENHPVPTFDKRRSVLLGLYKMLRAYTILGINMPKHKERSKPGLSGFLAAVDFETTADAREARETFDRLNLQGNKVYFRKSKLSMKHLGGASWEGGRRGEHKSCREQGSARGTNFEKVFSDHRL